MSGVSGRGVESTSSSGTLGTASLVAGSPQTLRYLSKNYTCGTDTFTYKVTDQVSASSAACTATVTITCVNHPPVATNLSYTMSENTLTVNNVLTINVNANDYDAGDAAQLVYVCTTSPTFGALSISPSVSYPVSQAILYNPTAYKNGVDGFACYVRDPAGATATLWWRSTIAPRRSATRAAKASDLICRRAAKCCRSARAASSAKAQRSRS